MTEVPEVFFPHQRPKRTDRDGVLAVLERAIEEVRGDASMDGSITYSWGDEPGMYWLHAFVRTGNDMGQGGAMVVHDASAAAPRRENARQKLMLDLVEVLLHEHMQTESQVAGVSANPAYLERTQRIEELRDYIKEMA